MGAEPHLNTCALALALALTLSKGWFDPGAHAISALERRGTYEEQRRARHAAILTLPLTLTLTLPLTLTLTLTRTRTLALTLAQAQAQSEF